MAKAYEITVWKPHKGKRGAFLKNWNEVAVVFKKAGVSEIQLLEGVAGKDVGNIIVIQHFKSLTDNGKINDGFFKNKEIAAWMKKHEKDDFAELVSHDLYSDAE